MEPPTPFGQAVLPAGSLGAVRLVWSEKGLIRLTFGEGGALRSVPERSVPDVIRENLSRYFAMEPSRLEDVPVELFGTAFQARIWTGLRTIPFGAVRSYSGLARDLGLEPGVATASAAQRRARPGSPTYARAIGMANARNPVPIVVPCHRVIAAGRKLGGFTGGLTRKRALLRLEGIAVQGDLVSAGQLPLSAR